MSYILIFSGKVGSGKSSISQIIADKFKFQWLSFGNYVRIKATQEGIEHTRINLQDLGEKLLKEDIKQFCNNVLNQVDWGVEPLVIDGLRHDTILQELRSIIYPNKIFHVHLNITDDIRSQRLLKTRLIEIKDINAIDSHQNEIQVMANLGDTADIIINADNEIDIIVRDLSFRIESLSTDI